MTYQNIFLFISVLCILKTNNANLMVNVQNCIHPSKHWMNYCQSLHPPKRKKSWDFVNCSASNVSNCAFSQRNYTAQASLPVQCPTFEIHTLESSGLIGVISTYFIRIQFRSWSYQNTVFTVYPSNKSNHFCTHPLISQASTAETDQHSSSQQNQPNSKQAST